jgi:hypothetical protein
VRLDLLSEYARSAIAAIGGLGPLMRDPDLLVGRRWLSRKCGDNNNANELEDAHCCLLL